MHRRKRTFAELLTRSLATAGLLYALVFVYAVPATLLRGPAPDEVRPDVSSLTQPQGRPSWPRVRSDRFPGCVDVATWGASRVPRTVVVERRDGRLLRMPFAEAYRRARNASAADDVWTIGACR